MRERRDTAGTSQISAGSLERDNKRQRVEVDSFRLLDNRPTHPCTRKDVPAHDSSRQLRGSLLILVRSGHTHRAVRPRGSADRCEDCRGATSATRTDRPHIGGRRDRRRMKYVVAGADRGLESVNGGTTGRRLRYSARRDGAFKIFQKNKIDLGGTGESWGKIRLVGDGVTRRPTRRD